MTCCTIWLWALIGIWTCIYHVYMDIITATATEKLTHSNTCTEALRGPLSPTHTPSAGNARGFLGNVNFRMILIFVNLEPLVPGFQMILHHIPCIPEQRNVIKHDKLTPSRIHCNRFSRKIKFCYNWERCRLCYLPSSILHYKRGQNSFLQYSSQVYVLQHNNSTWALREKIHIKYRHLRGNRHWFHQLTSVMVTGTCGWHISISWIPKGTHFTIATVWHGITVHIVWHNCIMLYT